MVNNSSNPLIRCWLCPLYCFNCDCDKVDLAEGIQIKRITSEFKGYLQKRCSDWFWLDPSDAECMAVLPYYNASISSRRKHVFDEGVEEGDLIEDLVTAFRLCRAGAVTPGPLVLAKFQNSEFSIYSDAYPVVASRSADGALDDFIDAIAGAEVGAISTYISKYGADPFASPRYDFRQSDVPQVNRLLVNLVKLRAEKKLSIDIALRRFNSAYHGEPEDRLVDQMIAFESLYIADNKELGYKLALRTAFLIGKKKAEIFSDMKDAYTLRGQIMHSDKQVDVDKIEEAIPGTEEYLRQSIRKFLFLMAQGHSLKEIRKRLDENILKNGRVLSLRESN
jgi:hypothetical protein